MEHQHAETNPHFLDAEEVTPDQREYIPQTLLPRQRGHDHRPRHHPPTGPIERQPPHHQRPQPLGDQHSRPPPTGPTEGQPPPPHQRLQPLGPSPPEQHHGDQPHVPLHVWVPPPHHEGQHRQGHQQPPPPLGIWGQLPSSRTQGPPTKKPKRGRSRKEVVMQPQLQDQQPSASLIRPTTQGESTTEHHPSPGPAPPAKPRENMHHHSALFLPRARRTKPITWFAAAFCIIFWLAIIIGGLIVLVVYLVFRPRSPRFDVTSVTFNAAYLDMGYLLNADIQVLANFTNPNKKVRIDYSYMYLDLYFENTLIATQYVEPFSASRGQSTFRDIHMVTSQVKLSMKETLLLQKQIENNRVMFTVKGVFRARSDFGSVWKYSYWLHGQCGIIVSSPPSGVLKAKLCKTRH
ncbi:Late embryogenesis abundant protein, LEA-14 [Corchorus capsularis]|uniref:Late embryogenesis abundant protein, LEA-14 n=1 Tax=Corchorus capsularis TaxID=210143 RepID=A0A1R3GQ83_COCAP|nr:Late embryogenesis abundant protein, LEA-14 [Corchorus capsularis]